MRGWPHNTPRPKRARQCQRHSGARTRAHEVGDLDAYTKADTDFHRAVVHASGNPLLARLHAAVAEADRVGEGGRATRLMARPPPLARRYEEARSSSIWPIADVDPSTTPMSSTFCNASADS